MELRQSLVVSYVGKGQAMLIFSDFFEEAVENTPARILVTNTHGCGKQYRNAFVRTQFQFHEYDSLFPYVKVQEPESLVCRLALGRLMFPYELESAYQNQYEEYVKAHNVEAASQAMERGAQEEVRWLLDWLLALALLFCGLLFAMPASLRSYVMQPLYAACSSAWPLGLFPLLIFMPYFPIRLRLLCRRMPRRLQIGVLKIK